MTEALIADVAGGEPRLARTVGTGLRRVRVGGAPLLLDLALVAMVAVGAGFRIANSRDVVALGAVTVLGLFGTGLLTGVYPPRHPVASFEGMLALWTAALSTTLLALCVAATFIPPGSSSEILFVGTASLVLMSGVRGLARVRQDRAHRPVRPVHRALVFGGGEAGENIIRVLLHSPDSEILPVAVLDDDLRKSGRRLAGLVVVGGRQQMAGAVQRFDADTLLVAASSGGRGLVAELAPLAESLGLAVRMLPPLEELLLGLARDVDIRPLDPAQLLGRREVVIDLPEVAGYLAGKVVLVTGAGGSIGSELCRQLSGLGLGELIMLDRDESALHDVQLSLDGRGLLDDNALVVADIRDRHRLDDIFAARRPDVVFHAAALKHLPLLQTYPTEAVKTNIWGTQNVLDSAAHFGVKRFVNISTDKAADAISVLGWSKRVGERLTASAAQRTGRPFLSVRFGNVLGSRGSVLTAFHSQIRAGGPVTVTHPEVTRYFMTVQEAVRLVIQSGAIGAPGEVLVLDMGEPVRIDDVARRLTRDADVEIVYTGLRPGEKLHEVLLGTGESDERPRHPLISQLPVPPLHPELLGQLNGIRARGPLIEALRDLAALPVDPTAPAQRTWTTEPARAVGV